MTPAARHGRLVTLEGIDGAGKSTVLRRLSTRWRARGLRVTTAREPADPLLGRMAQELGARDPWASAMLFTLDRMLARSRLERNLAIHDVVLQDRSYFSTLAYQGSALPAPEAARLKRLQSKVTVNPDRVVLLALDPSRALARLSRRGGAREPFERLRTLARVDRAYRLLARPPRWVTVDADRPLGVVVADVDRALGPWLEGGRRPRSSGVSSTSASSARRSQRP